MSPVLKFTIILKITAKYYFHLNCTGKFSVAKLHAITIPKLGNVTSPESKMAERGANVSHCTDFICFHLYSLLYWSSFSVSIN